MNIETIAKEILSEICGTDEILEEPAMDLIEEGFIDSFAVINAIVLIEEKMGITLTPEDIKKENVKSTNDFIAFLENLNEEKN